MNQEPCGTAKYFDFVLSEHAEVLAGTRENVAEAFVKLVTECVEAIQKEKKLLFFGNGGSDLIAGGVSKRCRIGIVFAAGSYQPIG